MAETEEMPVEVTEQLAVEEPQSKKRKIDELSAEAESAEAPAAEDATDDAADKPAEDSTNGGDVEMAAADDAEKPAGESTETAKESAEADSEEVKDKEAVEEEEEEEDETFEEYVETDDESVEYSEEQIKKFLKSGSHSAVLALAEKLVLADVKNEHVVAFCKDNENSSGNCKVFVRALPFDLKDTIFTKTFNNFGKVTEAIIIKDRATNRSKGFGFVTFTKARYAAKAVEAGTVKIGTREVHCSLAHPKNTQQPRNAAPPQRAFYGNPYAAYGRGPYRY